MATMSRIVGHWLRVGRPVHRTQMRLMCTNPKAISNASDDSVNDNVMDGAARRRQAYKQLENLDFMTATKILLTVPPKRKKFGFDFHLVQFFFCCLPSLAAYLVALYSRSEQKKYMAEKEAKIKAAEEAKTEEERIAAEAKAEEERIAAEAKAEEERIALEARLAGPLARISAVEETVYEMKTDMNSMKEGMRELKDILVTNEGSDKASQSQREGSGGIKPTKEKEHHITSGEAPRSQVDRSKDSTPVGEKNQLDRAAEASQGLVYSKSHSKPVTNFARQFKEYINTKAATPGREASNWSPTSGQSPAFSKPSVR